MLYTSNNDYNNKHKLDRTLFWIIYDFRYELYTYPHAHKYAIYTIKKLVPLPFRFDFPISLLYMYLLVSQDKDKPTFTAETC